MLGNEQNTSPVVNRREHFCSGVCQGKVELPVRFPAWTKAHFLIFNRKSHTLFKGNMYLHLPESDRSRWRAINGMVDVNFLRIFVEKLQLGAILKPSISGYNVELVVEGEPHDVLRVSAFSKDYRRPFAALQKENGYRVQTTAWTRRRHAHSPLTFQQLALDVRLSIQQKHKQRKVRRHKARNWRTVASRTSPSTVKGVEAGELLHVRKCLVYRKQERKHVPEPRRPTTMRLIAPEERRISCMNCYLA